MRLRRRAEKDENSSSKHTFPFAGTENFLVVKHKKNPLQAQIL